MEPEIGEKAGEIWQILNNDGPQTLSQLKKKVGNSNDLVNFALGWLAREDKVRITPEKKGYKVELN
ncbi:MAG: winged helix-turn-helix domain-containing protein [Acidobacteriia bacterium]|nr:winged helix-turn-helix domain-containing protein [Terriglobia bacterium]